MDYVGFHLTERFIIIADETFIDAMQNSNFGDEFIILFFFLFIYFSPGFCVLFPNVSVFSNNFSCSTFIWAAPFSTILFFYESYRPPGLFCILFVYESC